MTRNDTEFKALIAAAEKRVKEMDEVDGSDVTSTSSIPMCVKDGKLVPKPRGKVSHDPGMFMGVRTVLMALECSLRTDDVNVAADAYVMLRSIHDKLGEDWRRRNQNIA